MVNKNILARRLVQYDVKFSKLPYHPNQRIIECYLVWELERIQPLTLEKSTCFWFNLTIWMKSLDPCISSAVSESKAMSPRECVNNRQQPVGTRDSISTEQRVEVCLLICLSDFTKIVGVTTNQCVNINGSDVLLSTYQTI